MLEHGFKIINTIFHLICIACVVYYAYISVLEFLENKDLCEVSFKQFHSDKKSRYPSFSLCLTSPFVDRKFVELQSSVNSSLYELYLKGYAPGDEIITKIEPDNVSISEEDFITNANLFYLDELKSSQSIRSTQIEYWNMQFLFVKCFTYEVPFVEHALAALMKIDYNNSIFPNGIRPEVFSANLCW